jgi:hypothetical protein
MKKFQILLEFKSQDEYLDFIEWAKKSGVFECK